MARGEYTSIGARGGGGHGGFHGGHFHGGHFHGGHRFGHDRRGWWGGYGWPYPYYGYAWPYYGAYYDWNVVTYPYSIPWHARRHLSGHLHDGRRIHHMLGGDY